MAVIAAALVAGAAAQDRSNEVAIEGSESGDLQLYPAAGQDVCVKYPRSGDQAPYDVCMGSLLRRIQALETVNPVRYVVSLTKDRTDIDYIPLGSAPVNHPFSASLSFNGWGAGNGMQIDVTSDVFKASNNGGKGGANKVTVFTKENLLSGGNNHHMSFIFRHVTDAAGAETNVIQYYMKIEGPWFEECGDNQACKDSTHTVIVQPTGVSSSYLPGSHPDASDKDIAVNVGKIGVYTDATVVPLTPGQLTSIHSLTTDKDDFDYVPLGSSDVDEPFSVHLSIAGYGANHGLMVDLVSDVFYTDAHFATGKDKVTAYLKENAAVGAYNSASYLSIIYRHAPGVKNNRQIEYSLKIHGDYFNCEALSTAEQAPCLAFAHTVKVTAVNTGPSFKRGPDTVDADAKANDESGTMYHTATIQGQSPEYWRTKLTVDKTDFDYVPLGTGLSREPFSVQVGLQGPFTNHGLTIDILADEIAVTGTVGNTKNKITAFVKENNVPGTFNSANKLSVIFRNYKEDNVNKIQYYLKISGDYFNCDGRTAAQTKLCEDGNHYVHTTVTTSGPNYTPGSSPLAIDADVRTNDAKPAGQEVYFVATREGTNGESTWKIVTTGSKDGVDYVPIGVSHFGEPFSVHIALTSWGSAHGMKVEIIGDQIGQTVNAKGGDNRVTAYVYENQAGAFPARLDVISFIFRHAPGKANNPLIQYYMKVPGAYFNCDAYPLTATDLSRTACQKSVQNYQVTVVSKGPSFVPGSAANAIDPEVIANDQPDAAQAVKYTVAKTSSVAQTALAVQGVSEWQQVFTDDKSDTDFVPLGRTYLTDPISMNLGFKGFGTWYGIRVNAMVSAGNVARSTVTIQGISNLDAKKEYMKFYMYRCPKPLQAYVYVYMAVDAGYYRADCGTNAGCLKASHTVTVRVTGETKYVSGKSADTGGQDPNFEANWANDLYKPATIQYLN